MDENTSGNKETVKNNERVKRVSVFDSFFVSTSIFIHLLGSTSLKTFKNWRIGYFNQWDKPIAHKHHIL